MDARSVVARRMVVAVAFALALAGIAVGAPVQRSVKVTCTFNNRAYAGSCVESTTRSEKQKPAAACQPILDCLNDPQCAKSYCRATTVRQGWTLKSAE